MPACADGIPKVAEHANAAAAQSSDLFMRRQSKEWKSGHTVTRSSDDPDVADQT